MKDVLTIVSDMKSTAALVMLTLLLNGCASSSPVVPSGQAPLQAKEESPQQGGIFNVRIPSDPPSLDVQKESSINTVQAVSANNSTIIRYDPLVVDKIVPDLAERWEVAQDGKSITFHVRKGVKFHNGDELTAADIKFTLDRVRGVITQGPAALNAPRKDLMKAVDSVDAPDNATVILRLKEASNSLLSYIASPYNPVYDKKWVEAGHDPTKEENGSGAFKLKEYIRGTSIELTKFESYWNSGLPYLDTVKSYIVPDNNTTLAALKTGQITMLSLDVPTEATLRPQVEGGDLANKLAFMSTRQGGPAVLVWMNTTQKPFNDPRVRLALSLSIDRQELLKARGTPRQGSGIFGWLLPGSYWALSPEELAKIPGYGPDKAAERAQAKKLLADAGYPNGLTVKGLNRTEQGSIDTAVLYGAQFKTVGITYDMQPQDASIVADRQAKRDFEISVQRANSGTTEDPDTFYGQFMSCDAPRNYGGWCDQKFEDLNLKQTHTLDPAARRAIAWEIEKYVLTQAPVLPDPINTPGLFAINKQIRGWAPLPDGYSQYRFDSVWIAK